jgi:23S rRNA (guanosine2251-2'-O)-methyltransferase
MQREIIVIAHNIRSAHNVGAILRTCDGFGASTLLFSGYTPYPTQPSDPRLPHLAAKITRDIHKTALGAEKTVRQRIVTELPEEIADLRQKGYRVVGLEQTAQSTMLDAYQPPSKIVLLLGEERYGLTPDLLERCDDVVEIPMKGDKESFNVSVAAGVALYHLTCM